MLDIVVIFHRVSVLGGTGFASYDNFRIDSTGEKLISADSLLIICPGVVRVTIIRMIGLKCFNLLFFEGFWMELVEST